MTNNNRQIELCKKLSIILYEKMRNKSMYIRNAGIQSQNIRLYIKVRLVTVLVAFFLCIKSYINFIMFDRNFISSEKVNTTYTKFD